MSMLQKPLVFLVSSGAWFSWLGASGHRSSGSAHGVYVERSWVEACTLRLKVGTISQTQTPGQVQKVDPPSRSMIYTIGVLEPRIGGSTFWILPGVLAKKHLKQISAGSAWVRSLAPKLQSRAASGGELRRGESIEGLYKACTGMVLRLHTSYIRLM